ncbi:MAG: Flp pilus assembly protein CpaB, partial [Alphaproteobacteria bacterium]
SDTYVVQSDDAGEIFVGAVVRSGIAEGEPITTGRVVRPGDRGFLAAVLQPGHRAISVAVNATSGISGFVFPGDRVDLILTHAVQYEDRPPRHAAETIMSDVRVLAIDQSTDDQEGEPTLAKTATLEVTPRQAEVIGVASELGHLSLSLRSMATAETPDILRTFTWDSQASRLIPFDATGRVVRVVVSRGNKEEIVELGAP